MCSSCSVERLRREWQAAVGCSCARRAPVTDCLAAVSAAGSCWRQVLVAGGYVRGSWRLQLATGAGASSAGREVEAGSAGTRTRASRHQQSERCTAGCLLSSAPAPAPAPASCALCPDSLCHYTPLVSPRSSCVLLLSDCTTVLLSDASVLVLACESRVEMTPVLPVYVL